MGKHKLRLLYISIIAILFTFLSQEALIYYTTLGNSANVITSGEIKMQIVEKGYGDVEYHQEGIYVMPGDIVTKRLSIRSLCDHPFYLRVKIVYGINSEELSAEDCFKLNIDESIWLYHDGWYYYNGIVEAGQETPNVFSQVEIVGNKMDANYIGKTLQLTVDAQALQSENNPIPNDGLSALPGWPGEEA